MATDSSVLFFFFFRFSLEANYFIILWWGFCHALTWISHGCRCVPHPETPSHIPPHPIPLGLPSAPASSTCLMHPTWAADLFYIRWFTCFNAILSNHPTLAFSHSVQKTVLYICSLHLFLSRIQGHCYHLSKFHIRALVYSIGVFFFLSYNRLVSSTSLELIQMHSS